MNKNRHRIVFNAARGQHMAVSETASSFGGPSSPPMPALAFAALLLTLLASAQAQVVADPSAPGNQRPTILQTANGLPQINIQTPSAAGVSRNTYRQFDVQSNGAILNNSRTNVQTQIGGFVSGNPWIGTPARVILNEVNSNNPSHLNGPVEVAGQRAEVVIANPSGIHVNGGTFINASGVTLTTGTPVMNSGNLESFRVTQGTFVVEGLGLDTRTADYTTILARAMEVNAGLWAKHLKVVTGANDISADGNTVTVTPANAQGPTPRFMLDVAAIGGMYAGHIFLVGTEAGLGVNNGGVLSADAGNLVLDSDGWLRNKGTVQASGNVAITTQGEVKNDKDLYAGGTLSVTTSQALTNSGSIGAQGGVQIQATTTENLAGARIASNATVQVNTSGAQTNQGEIVSAGNVTLQAARLQNEGRLLSIAGDVNITSQGDVDNSSPTAQMYAAGTQHINAAGALTNSGLIAAHGNLTVEANSVHSTGALAAGLNTDGSLKADAALMDVRATQQLTAQGHNLASGHLKLEGQALDIAGSQTQAKTLVLDATGRETVAAPGTGLIDASNADVLALGWIDIDGKTLKTTGAQLQALSDIRIVAQEIHNQEGLIRAGGHLTAVADEIDNRDTRTSTSAAPLGLIAQSMDLTTGALLNQSGAIIAGNGMNIVSAGRIENAQGLLSAGGTLDIRETTPSVAVPASLPVARTLSITNTGGTLIADQRLAVAAQSLSLDGDLLSQQDMTLSVQGDHTHAAGSRIVANQDLTIDIEDGGLINRGELLAGRNLGFTADSLDNTTTGDISAGDTTDIRVTAALTNRGLIDGKNTLVRADALSNIGTGRIYGDALAIQADSLRNDTETINGVRTDAVIAARSDSGSASSTTTAGISGIAGDKAIRSTDAEAGSARIFEKERVQKEIEAQARITEAFSREAPKAVASYAAARERALTQQLQDETDPAKKEELQAEIDKWKEGGAYRVALHTAVGALGGGWSGAAGAAVSGASANLLQAMQDNLQESLEEAGLGDGIAKGIAQGIATLTAAGMGAAVGGAYGAASAATVDANNRQLHSSEKKLAKELAKKSDGKYTVEQIEEQMRLMGNKAFDDAANKTEALTTPEAIAKNLEQDPNMPKVVDGTAVVEIPGQADPELQRYIIGNSNGADYIPGQSPYVASNPALNRPATTGGPRDTTATARCANGDTACITGVGQQQSAPLTQQTKEAIADAAEATSRGAGVIAAGATAVAAQGGPHAKPAQIIAVGATTVGAAADAIEQLVRPDLDKAIDDSLAAIAQDRIEKRIPLAAPIANEMAELWKNSSTNKSLHSWADEVWSRYLEKQGLKK